MSYRSRLLLYVGMLIVLLIGMMTLSFKTARDVIVASTQEHLHHVAAHKAEDLDAQVRDLGHYAGLIAGDLWLQEQLGGAGTAGISGEQLAARYHQLFGLLPGHVTLILSAGGEALPGGEHRQLLREVRQRGVINSGGHFFFASPQGVVMVVTQPVANTGRHLGTVVVARAMDEDWLNTQEQSSSDYLLFFERRGQVLWSSNARYKGVRFDERNRRLEYQGDQFRLDRIPYGKPLSGLPVLWFGMNESSLTQLLTSYQRWVFSFAALGCLAVVLVGWLVLRNFSKPMAALMFTTEQMMKGELPVMVRSQAKSEMDRLVNRFADVLDSLRREQAKLERANRKLQETAITDSLTGLHNRRYLQEVTPGLFAQVVRDQRHLIALLIDLDYFKAINDSWGHLGGDAVLVHFSQLLQHNSRANDFLFRIGGEEFLILNVSETPRDSVALAEKIRELVSRSPAAYQGNLIPITVSIGVSCCYGKSGDISLSMLMRAADKALYEAKSTGRNRVVLHSSCPDTARLAKPRPRITLIEGGNNNTPGS